MGVLLVGIYSTVGSKLAPHTLSDSELLNIGRLIRACAEIEDIVTGYLCSLAKITHAQAIFLLGRASTSQRLAATRSFAVSQGEIAIKLYDECFGNDHYRDIIRCRNTVAHGRLLGKTEEGNIAFQVQETVGIEGEKVFLHVNAYPGDAFGAFAKMAESVIPQLVNRLHLEAWRDEPLKQFLSAYPNERGRRKHIAKSNSQSRLSQNLARQAKLAHKARQRLKAKKAD